jgi:hypothetical protein
MQIDLGVGTPTSNPAVIGVLGRVSPYFGRGTDLSLAARMASRGFAVGDWGLALDAGGYERWWGVGSVGGLVSLSIGAPFGFTLSANASFGTNDNRTFAAILGIDLLRLTVYRLGGESLWANPRPAWRPGQQSP